MWACQSLLLDVFDRHAPLKSKIIKYRGAPYMHSELRKAIFRRNMLKNSFLKHKSNAKWEKYRIMRNLCVKMRKKAIRDYFQRKCSERTSGPDFWKTIKPFLSNKNLNGHENIILLEN